MRLARDLSPRVSCLESRYSGPRAFSACVSRDRAGALTQLAIHLADRKTRRIKRGAPISPCYSTIWRTPNICRYTYALQTARDTCPRRENRYGQSIELGPPSCFMCMIDVFTYGHIHDKQTFLFYFTCEKFKKKGTRTQLAYSKYFERLCYPTEIHFLTSPPIPIPGGRGYIQIIQCTWNVCTYYCCLIFSKNSERRRKKLLRISHTDLDSNRRSVVIATHTICHCAP